MIEKLKDLQIGEVLEDIDLKEYNTYRVSCLAKALVKPKDIESLKRLLYFLQQEKIEYRILGNGSNILFVSSTYPGVLIKLDAFQKIEIEDTNVVAEAGVPLIYLAQLCAQKGLSGLEFASGIPGLVGASVIMNVGAHNGEISSIVKTVKVLTKDLEVKELTKNALNFSYRNSFLKEHKEYIVLEVTLELQKKNPEDILNIMQEYIKTRKEHQPIDAPSAGSVFKNPSNDSAGRIIESLGLKGKRIGGAEVSQKHANFIVNTGTATGQDIYDLILFIQKSVKEKYNIDLSLEQELI